MDLYIYLHIYLFIYVLFCGFIYVFIYLFICVFIYLLFLQVWSSMGGGVMGSIYPYLNIFTPPPPKKNRKKRDRGRAACAHTTYKL